MLPASAPMTKPTRTTSLRRIVRLLPSRSLRLRRFFRRAPEAALEVVEDEADRRRRPGCGGDSPRAVAHDKDTAVVGRSLELGDRCRVAREVVDPRQQLGGG